ncbi:undecaprenyl-phosphate galactose phosphotransferase WbaP [Nodosilinea sp. PGN35]|uniref:undecaprenyl-phosphate galactose phosphotransferase WbaP n=1 Tax=Nodosilinea sp. PGN35 TaxID=3020489 RepID=UPI00241452BD|nr:undecaprenyl-phosphate galactose phosphotransferase WbaP [Nodosilinea sp. TSF1-S3]
MFPLERTVQPVMLSLRMSTRSLPMVALLSGSDLLALALAGSAGVYLRLAFGGEYLPSLYGQLWPILGVFLLAYAVAGLYPAVGLSPVDELRRICLSTTFTYLVLAAGLFLTRESETYSRGVFLLAWLLSLIAVLTGRLLVKQIFARCPWWGYQVLILGGGRTGELVIQTLKNQPNFGLKPVAVLDDGRIQGGSLCGVPIVGPLSAAPSLARRHDIHYAIVAMPGVQREQLLRVLELYGRTFPHLLMIPDLFGVASLWVSSKDLGGILGLEIRQQLLLPGPRLIKTLLDIVLTLVVGLCLLPLLGVIAVLVKLDSPGPVFYGQPRLGQNNVPFVAWKFRSMVPNAERVLERHLEENPALRQQWELDHKLRYDPRITRVGHFLRRTSLDELPQLWNVLRGDMSLVGPRPIVEEEVFRYADKYTLYTKVLPGLTGLWQVSGRNNVSYEERVNLDAYYVRNWSVWLDVYILLKTIWVVVIGDGAY